MGFAAITAASWRGQMVHRYFGFVRFAGRPCSFTNMQSLTVGWADLSVPVQLTSIDGP